MIVDLANMREHLRVDHADEDSAITAYTKAAEAQVSNWIGRPIYATEAELPTMGQSNYDRFQVVADDRIRVAIMILVDRIYNQRGGEGAGVDDAVPPAEVRAILGGHRVFSGTE